MNGTEVSVRPLPFWRSLGVALLALGTNVCALIVGVAIVAIALFVDPQSGMHGSQRDALHAVTRALRPGSIGGAAMQLGAYGAPFVVLAWFLPSLAGKPLRALVHPFRGRDMRVFTVFFLAGIGLRILDTVYRIATHQAAHQQAAFRNVHFDSPVGFVAFALVLCVAAPVVEELFFRGLLFPALLGHMPWVAAAALTALAFAAAHADLVVLPIITGFGFLSALAYRQSGNLAVPMALHASQNLIALALLTFVHYPHAKG